MAEGTQSYGQMTGRRTSRVSGWLCHRVGVFCSQSRKFLDAALRHADEQTSRRRNRDISVSHAVHSRRLGGSDGNALKMVQHQRSSIYNFAECVPVGYNLRTRRRQPTDVVLDQHPGRSTRTFRKSERTMATLPVQHERRAAQRFDFHLPVSIRQCGCGTEEPGFTQNISARGAFIYTDRQITQGSDIELTLMMPSEITLTENMRVRCRGKVLRATQPTPSSRVGLAVHLEGYEFLPDQPRASDVEGSFERLASLHKQPVSVDEVPKAYRVPRRSTAS